MKKIFTLLFAVGMFTLAQAQPGSGTTGKLISETIHKLISGIIIRGMAMKKILRSIITLMTKTTVMTTDSLWKEEETWRLPASTGSMIIRFRL